MSIADSEFSDLPQDRFIDIDLASENLRQNYRMHLTEWAKNPPFYVMQSGLPQAVVSRYEDMKEVLCNPTRFSGEFPTDVNTRFKKFLPSKLMDVTNLPEMEGEAHARIRRLINPTFSPKNLVTLDSMVTSTITRLIDDMESKGPDVDLMSDLASRLMPEILLRGVFCLNDKQTDCFVAMNSAVKLTAKLKPGEDFPADYLVKFNAAKDTIQEMITERRATPGNDFISHLIQARDKDSVLSDQELFDLLFSFCVGGIDTTTTTFGAAFYTLVSHPDQFSEVKHDLSLVPQALEEAMRYHTAGFLLFTRYALEDTEIGGLAIPKGMPVYVCHQAASLDSAHYPEAEKFDIHRQPTNVPIFGHGAHICPGSKMARMVLIKTLTKILSRFPKVALTDAGFKPYYTGELAELQLKSLPVRLW